MKASVFLQKHDIQIQDFDLGKLEADEVFIKVKYCGVCGTDIHIYHGHSGSVDVSPPIILGHECSGTVTEVGTSVTSLSVGDNVTVNPNDMCGECYFCRAGKSAFCENHLAVGTIAHGGFAEYIKVRAKQVHKFSNIGFKKAALVEPLSCCYNVFEVIKAQLGDCYLIVGGGPVGLMMLQLAKIAGAAKIFLAEIVPEKRIIALKFGADAAFDPRTENVQDLMRRHNVKNLDKIIECVGRKATQEYCLKNLGKGTEVMFFGLGPASETITIHPFEIFRNQAIIASSFINPYTFEKTLRLAESGKIDLSPIISDIVAQEELPDVLLHDERRKKGKVLIELDT